MKTILLLCLSFFSLLSFSNNLHLIEQKQDFALYRLGAPNQESIKQLCSLGVKEIMVLSGNAEEYEDQMQDFCPSLKVIYNKKQSHAVPLTKIFLEDFDNWIQSAQKEGKKIAFRCNCGCHRTGRLAAYYQMKYQNIPMADALAIMNKHGKYMLFFPSLKPQVKALNDYINGSPCSTKERYCVTN